MSSIAKAAPAPTYARRWWTLVVLSVSLVIIGLDNTILNVALPTLQREFNASASGLQWIVDAYILVFAGLLLTMGSLGDRFGRKRALQAGLVIFGVASLLATAAQSSGQLIAARALMGVGGALIMPSTLSVIVDVFPREERGKAIGIWTGVAALGIAIGPMLGGWLLEHFNWSAVFFINVPIVLLALAAGLVLVPESRDAGAPPIDLGGAVLSVAALSALVFAIIEAPGRGWLDPLVLGGFAGALALGSAFVMWERRAGRPMLDIRLFADRRFSAGAGAIALAFLVLFGALFLFTQYLQFVRGYSALQAGLRLTPLAIGMMLGASNSHRLVRRFGTARVVAGGMLTVAVVAAAMSQLDTDTAAWLFSLGLVALAAGMGNTMAPATEAVMGAVPEANAGVGSAMNDTSRQVGGALGIAVLGSLFNAMYAAHMIDATAELPAAQADAAQNSVGMAMHLAGVLGSPAGEALQAAAARAFVDALSTTLLIGAGIAAVGALLVLRFLPGRPSPAPVSAPRSTPT